MIIMIIIIMLPCGQVMPDSCQCSSVWVGCPEMGNWANHVDEGIQGVSEKMQHSDFQLKSVPEVQLCFFTGVSESDFEPISSEHFEHTHSEYKMPWKRYKKYAFLWGPLSNEIGTHLAALLCPRSLHFQGI